MKKLTFLIMATCTLLLFTPINLNARNHDGKIASDVTGTAAIENTNSAASAQIEADLARLEEIKAMDFSTMSRTEKKAVRSELKAIKNNLESNGYAAEAAAVGNGGIYLSVGALIVIVLLLILLL